MVVVCIEHSERFLHTSRVLLLCYWREFNTKLEVNYCYLISVALK